MISSFLLSPPLRDCPNTLKCQAPCWPNVSQCCLQNEPMFQCQLGCSNNQLTCLADYLNISPLSINALNEYSYTCDTQGIHSTTAQINGSISCLNYLNLPSYYMLSDDWYCYYQDNCQRCSDSNGSQIRCDELLQNLIPSVTQTYASPSDQSCTSANILSALYNVQIFSITTAALNNYLDICNNYGGYQQVLIDITCSVACRTQITQLSNITTQYKAYYHDKCDMQIYENFTCRTAIIRDKDSSLCLRIGPTKISAAPCDNTKSLIISQQDGTYLIQDPISKLYLTISNLTISLSPISNNAYLFLDGDPFFYIKNIFNTCISIDYPHNQVNFSSIIYDDYAYGDYSQYYYLYHEHGYYDNSLTIGPCIRNFYIMTDYLPAPPQNYKWVQIPDLSDEFNVDTLDTTKWSPIFPYWNGRAPSEFNASNTEIKNGYAVLSSTLKVLPTDPSITDPNSDIWIWAASLASTRSIATYGYYEANIKTSNLSMSNVFWLQTNNAEIDIIEQVSAPTTTDLYKAQTYSSRLNSGSHQLTNGYDTNKMRKWKVPCPTNIGFNTYGVWWKNATTLWFYHNNIKVSEIGGLNFTNSMYVFFTTEILSDLGLPTVESLLDNTQNKMYIDYIRSWTLQ